MALKNRNVFPPGGFSFTQPETGWSAPAHLSFDDTVGNIISHRRANPRFNLTTDRYAVEQELEQTTIARLRSIPTGENYLTTIDGGPPGPFIPPPRQSRVVGAVASLAGEARKIRTGLNVIKDWLGDGLTPVAPELATTRAAVCVPCPLNQPPTATQVLTGTASKWLKQVLEAKSDMELATPHDSKLQTCAACGCRLDTKVFTPLPHIWRHSKPEDIAALDAACWILRERAESGISKL